MMTGRLLLSMLVVAAVSGLAVVSGAPVSPELTSIYELYGRRSDETWLTVWDDSYGAGRYQGWGLLSAKRKPHKGLTKHRQEQLEEQFGGFIADGVMKLLDEGQRQGEKRVLVAPPVMGRVWGALEEGGYKVETLSADVENLITSSFSSRLRTTKTVTDNFLELHEVEQYLKDLQREHPNRVNLTIVGQSIRNRPIMQLTVHGGGPASDEAPIVLIDGGMHAREWISTATCLYVLSQLVEDPSLTRGLEWRVIPVVNPDGYFYSWEKDRFWRKNRRPNTNSSCVGVDINRNFPIDFAGEGASAYPCAEDFSGAAAHSEPETVALISAVQEAGDRLKGYLNLHSYGQLILLPWAHRADIKHPNHLNMTRVAEGVAAEIERVNGTKFAVEVVTDGLYPASGISTDWVASQNVSYSLVIELQDFGIHGFLWPESKIEQAVTETWQGIKYFGQSIKKEFSSISDTPSSTAASDAEVVSETGFFDESDQNIIISTESTVQDEETSENITAAHVLTRVPSVNVLFNDTNTITKVNASMTIISESLINKTSVTSPAGSTDNSLLLLQAFITRITNADDQATDGDCGDDTDCKVSQVIKQLVKKQDFSSSVSVGDKTPTESFLLNDQEITEKIQDGTIAKTEDLVKHFIIKFT